MTLAPLGACGGVGGVEGGGKREVVCFVILGVLFSGAMRAEQRSTTREERAAALHHLEAGADGLDQAAVDQHVRLEARVVVDDGAALLSVVGAGIRWSTVSAAAVCCARLRVRSAQHAACASAAASAVHVIQGRPFVHTLTRTNCGPRAGEAAARETPRIASRSARNMGAPPRHDIVLGVFHCTK